MKLLCVFLLLFSLDSHALKKIKNYPKDVKEEKKSEKVVKKNVRKYRKKEVLGPHKGRMRNAGPFRTEMNFLRRGVEVYLLSKKSLEPSIKNSKLEGQLYVGKQEFDLKFRALKAKNRFFARWPKRLKRPKKGQDVDVSLVLLPTRDGVLGGPVLYKDTKL